MKKLIIVASLLVAALLWGACAAPAAAPTPTKAPAKAPPVAPKAEAPPAPAPAKAPAEPKRMLMGTTQSASSVYLYYVAVAKVINSKVPEVNVTPAETGATVENIKRMHRAEFDLALAGTVDVYQAMHGLGSFKDDPAKELRFLWVRSLLPCPPIVREDSGVNKIEDLSGKEFNAGIRGSSTEANTKAYFEALGIKPKWYVGGTEDAIAAVKDKRIVGYSKCMGGPNVPDSSVLDLMTFTKVRMLPLTEEHVQKVREQIPWFSTGYIEAGTFKAEWNKEPILAWGSIAGTATTTRMAEELAYKITKAIVEDNRPGGEGVLAAAFPGVKGLDTAKLTIDLITTPIHAGAIKYYKELGLQLKDEQIPPEAK